jgi:hypothetical protein
MCRVSARRLSCMGTPKGHQKSIFNTPKVKKDTYGFYPTKFASITQKHKKVIETQNQPIKIKKILKKLSEHQIYQSGR